MQLPQEALPFLSARGLASAAAENGPRQAFMLLTFRAYIKVVAGYISLSGEVLGIIVASWKDPIRIAARAVSSLPVMHYLLLGLARARVLPEALWTRLPVERAFKVQLPGGASFLYSSTVGDGVGRALYWGGPEAWEGETVRVFFQLAKEAKCFLDIGAHAGVYTLLACAANSDLRAVAFEAVPGLYERLVAHLDLNGWQDRCRAHKMAVSNVVGTTYFHVPSGDSPGSGSLDRRGFRGSDGALVEVSVTTIDAICRGEERVDLVKVDVEGFENKVLEGMQGVLTSSRPIIFVELLRDGPRQATQVILERHGYRFFHLRPEGPCEVTEMVPDAAERYRNFLCTPRDLKLRSSSFATRREYKSEATSALPFSEPHEENEAIERDATQIIKASY